MERCFIVRTPKTIFVSIVSLIRKHWRIIFIAILLALAITYRGEAEQIAKTIISAPAWLFFAALATVLIEFALQALRMHLVFKERFGETLRAYAVGHFVAFSFPSRTLGEGARIGAIAKELGVKVTETAAYVSVERLMDMMVILTAAMAILWAINAMVAAIMVGAVTIGFYVLATEKLPRGIENALPTIVAEYLNNGRRILRNRRLAAALFLITVMLWLIDFFRMWMILVAMGAHVSYPVVAALVSIAYILGVVSFLPGGLGAYEGSLIGGLVLHGVPADISVAATFYERFFSYWLWIIVGALAGMKGRKN